MLQHDFGVLCAPGGGKAKATGKMDIAVMQSLSCLGEVNLLVENCGQVIVDECHHVGAASFDAILKRTKARYVLGLTATPLRRDGQQPIIFMQCGPIRHTATRPAGARHECATKRDGRVFDIVHTGHPPLLRMWEKRQRGFRAMGYRIGSQDLANVFGD